MSKKLLLILVALGLSGVMPVHAAGVKCPTTLKSFVALEDNNSSEDWLLGGPRQTYVLKGARVFTGKLSEESIQPSSEVKPIPHMERLDEKKVFYQVWHLEDPRFDNALLICDYAGSDNYLIYALAPAIKQCSEIDPMEKTETTQTRVECQ